MLSQQKDFMYSAIDEFNWDAEVYEMKELGAPRYGWLTAEDPVFWCLAPAHLEEAAWLFHAAPAHQPYDFRGYPITLLEYYLRMELLKLLDRLFVAPKKIYDAIRIVWARVNKRRNLVTKNSLNHSSGPELDWLLGRDPDLPPSWEVSLTRSKNDDRSYTVSFFDCISKETAL